MGTPSLLPEKRQTRWELLPNMALGLSCRYNNRVRQPAVCKPPIYITTAVTIALQTYKYPEMSGLHSKQLPTENVVKIKYASLIIYFKEKQLFFFFFKLIVAKLTCVWLQPRSAGSMS